MEARKVGREFGSGGDERVSGKERMEPEEWDATCVGGFLFLVRSKSNASHATDFGLFVDSHFFYSRIYIYI
jgi:hypothetical protein